MADNLLVPKSVDNFLEKATDKPAACIGDTIADIWYLVFGGIGQVAEKKRIKYACDLQKFRDELDAKVNAIPPEKIVEPNLQIIGPALEDVKYCVEEDVLRSLFSNLITASLNSDTSSRIHPSFSKLLAEITPFDANNLACFRKKSDLPIAQYRYKTSNGYKIMQTHVFLSNPNTNDIAKTSISIETLCRISLISVRYDEHLLDTGLYDGFETTPQYLKFIAFSNAPELKEQGIMEAYVQRGTARLTPLGKQFLAVCMPLKPAESITIRQAN